MLAEVVREATVQESLSVEDCQKLQTQIAQTQSLAEIDHLWEALSEEYRIIEPYAPA